MKERLLQLMGLLNLTATQFSNTVGIQRSTLQHIIGGRNDISLKVVMAIHDAYPNFNSDWLLYGTGQPFTDEAPVSSLENGDYPLFSQPENTEIPVPIQEKAEFSNVREEKEPVAVSEPSDTKTVDSPIISQISGKGKQVKEIIVFFDDGTFETFHSSH